MDRILHPETRLLVCDGRKALFLRNGGPAGRPAFEVEQEMHEKGASHTADLGADEPGRLKSAFGPRSSVEGTDWRQAAEDAFVRKAVDAFTALCDAHDVREVVLVAPPRALATIRKIASKSLHDRVVGEIDKDLTKHPVHELERIVNG
jgi:protein required for attachment to host cells